MKAKINLKNIYSYIQGNIRYRIYYSKFRSLLSTHILEQIEYRIKIMDKECYNNGSCKLCGCKTTALQMANKSCDKPCYPPMMNQTKWFKFILGQAVKIGKDVYRLYYRASTSSYCIIKNDKIVHEYE